MATINGVKAKVFSKPKPSKDDIVIMNPIDTHLIKDSRKRTAKRNKEHEVESQYIWLAIPVLLISWILIRWIIG